MMCSIFLAKPKKAKPVVDGRNNRKQAMKDMAPCQTMLAEMERHEDSWPFLVPVNAKQVSADICEVDSGFDVNTYSKHLKC